jgi:uncharacterized protein (DUF433 family)
MLGLNTTPFFNLIIKIWEAKNDLSLLIINDIKMKYSEHISIDPEIRFGKPCIKGTRITVYDVLSWMANGMSQEEILEDFPELNQIQIQACLAYAADREHKLKVA